jgi:2-polyprenyl-3-methyl-5-hydroxy-6-metoxy-1,4-benzoquinol methylase
MFVTRDACPACKSKLLDEIYRLDYTSAVMVKYLDSFYGPQGKGVEHDYLKGGNYILKKCQKCKTVFQAEIFGEFLMGKLYGEWIDPDLALARANGYDSGFYFNYANELMLILSYLSKKPNQLNFLDFGMGWGKWCLMAKAFGCNVVGVELSEHRKRHAKSQAIEVIDLGHIKNRTFDFINTEQVLEHIANPLDTLTELVLALKEDGIIKVSVPNGNTVDKLLKIMDWNATKGSANSLNVVAPFEHINCFNFDAVVRMGGLCGLKVVEEITYAKYSVSINHSMRENLKNIYEKYMRKNFEPYVFFRKS